MAIKFAIDEISFIMRSFKLKSSFSGFLSFNKISRVDYLALVPDLSTLTVLDIMYPVSIIEGAILVNKDTFAMSFSVEPLAMVDVAIGVSHLTFAVEHLVHSESFILRAVLELDNTQAFPRSLAFLPVALVFPVLVNRLEIVIPSQEFTIFFQPFVILLLMHKSFTSWSIPRWLWNVYKKFRNI